MRSRQIQTEANEYGKPCDLSAAVEVAPCELGCCESVDCKWSEWSDWGAPTCTGLCERHRSIEQHYRGCGKVCEGAKVINRKVLKK